jgi:hypothetical protein
MRGRGPLPDFLARARAFTPGFMGRVAAMVNMSLKATMCWLQM